MRESTSMVIDSLAILLNQRRVGTTHEKQSWLLFSFYLTGDRG
jgi:hypothetical protein